MSKDQMSIDEVLELLKTYPHQMNFKSKEYETAIKLLVEEYEYKRDMLNIVIHSVTDIKSLKRIKENVENFKRSNTNR